jgi:hypothetical protein
MGKKNCMFEIVVLMTILLTAFYKVHFKRISLTRFSCSSVALWFYNLVSDHNATGPVVQKSCNLRSIFSAHFGVVFFHYYNFLTLQDLLRYGQRLKYKTITLQFCSCTNGTRQCDYSFESLSRKKPGASAREYTEGNSEL